MKLFYVRVLNMEDYYYSNDEKTETSTEGDYYNAKPYTRAQFIKVSPHIDDKVKSMRWCGGFIVLCMIIDIFRIYRKNTEYDIESYFKLIGLLFVGLIILEVAVQIWAIPICSMIQLLLSSLILYNSFKVGGFLFPPGNAIIVACAIHIEQTSYLERKWQNYKKINY